MAIGEISFFSEALSRMTSFRVLIPGDFEYFRANNPHYERRMKTIYLLHGFSNNSWEWMALSDIYRLSGEYNFAVIMPNGENSFYLDRPGKGGGFGTYVGEELVAYTRKLFGLSEKREDTFVGGISMGGFGALRTGLAYSQTFGGIMALSSALIVHNIEGRGEDYSDHGADYAYYRATFGDLNELPTSRNNPEQIIRDLQNQQESVPQMYLACGTEDFLLQENRQFKQFLEQRGLPFQYYENAGSHDFDFWNPHLRKALDWMATGAR